MMGVELSGDLIDRANGYPLYLQIRDLLLGWIKGGRLSPGSSLPPERKLSKLFGVSRGTVRAAVAELEREGVLYRIQGSGTYVAPRRATVLRALVPEREWKVPLYEAENAYNRAHPDEPVHIDVRVVGRPRLRDELVLAVAAGQAPDIALIDCVWLAELAHLKFLIPVDKAAPKWAQEFSQDLLPGILDGNHHSDGHLYGVQTEASASVIWYRKDLLKKVGIERLSTWDELVEAGRRLKRSRKELGLSDYPIAFCAGVRGGETTVYQLLPLIWGVGERLLDGDHTSLGAGTIEVLKSLESLIHGAKLVSPQAVAFPWDEPRRLFAQGKVAISFGGTYEKRAIQSMAHWNEAEFRARVGMAPIPTLGSERPSVLGGMVFTVLRQSQQPELALEVLKLVASPELMERFCLCTSRIPSRRSVLREINSERYWFLHEVTEVLALARPRPWSPFYAKLSAQFRIMVEDVLTHRLSPDQAVARARHGIQALVTE